MKKPIIEGAFCLPVSPEEKPYLRGSRCINCGYVAFPPRVICPICIRDNTMEEVSLGFRGELDSFAVVRQAPAGFVAPYMLGMVQLPDGPEVFTMITGCDIDDDALVVGQEMELVIDKISEDDEGNEMIGWKFKPATCKEGVT